jgi:hypothetical protein
MKMEDAGNKKLLLNNNLELIKTVLNIGLNIAGKFNDEKQ